MDAVPGLLRLDAQVRDDLAKIGWPSAEWVPSRPGPDGRPMLDVLVVGAGQGGQAVTFQLLRERVTNVLAIDRADAGWEGPWLTYARMKTLRSPKFTTGPDLDIPSLTFQSWYEAQHGRDGWEALGKIPKALWAGYLGWYRDVLRLPVRNRVALTGLTPLPGGGLAAAVETPEGPQTLYARSVVLATGIEGTGRWWMPEFVAALPETMRAHTSDPIDFEALRGKVVAVLGAGASAVDNAATAIEAGAAAVHLFVRRPDLQRVQPYKQISYTGFLRHFGDLDDGWRWRIMTHVLDLREAFPVETWRRFTDHPNAHIHTGCGWTGARMQEGRVILDTPQGPFAADFLICGTGLDMDLAARPELAALAPHVARWADRYTPPPGQESPRLARYPYLGPSLELVERIPGTAPWLSSIRVFTFGATMSMGPSGSSINAMKFAVPRLVQGITRDLFRADIDTHWQRLLDYDVAEF